MPRGNRFQHQAYTRTRPTSPLERLAAGSFPPAGSEAYRRRFAAVGAALRSSRVAAIWLVHGTLVGNDAAGLVARLERLVPAAARPLRTLAKALADAALAETGNYTPRYAQQLAEAINPHGGTPIAVELFNWSSENHHLGRADGAVRLIDALAAARYPDGSRVLLWGHSHAGNVFALASNLLGGSPDSVAAFFEAARPYYRLPLVRLVDVPHWERIRRLLTRVPAPLSGMTLDVATFGTPVRYGWESRGYARLVHFINHRPCPGLPEHLTVFPPTLDRVLAAADGDYVQHLGIAGTNLAPSLFNWRAAWADLRLNRLLQGDCGPGDLLARLRLGQRAAAEGTTLLVDYGPPVGSIAQHHGGHAVYTHPQWLLFHAEEIARRFYGLEACPSARLAA